MIGFNIFPCFINMEEGAINIYFQLTSERKSRIFLNRWSLWLLDEGGSRELSQNLQSWELGQQGVGVLGEGMEKVESGNGLSRTASRS